MERRILARRYKRLHLMLLGVAACMSVYLTGCAPQPDSVYTVPKPQARLCRVALLPLLNESEDSTATALCYRTMLTELIAAPEVQISNPTDMQNILRRREIFPSSIYAAPPHVLQDIAAELDVDGYLRVKILAYEQRNVGRSGEVPHIALQLELLQTDGSLVSQLFHARSGDEYRSLMHYGVIRTYTGLLARMMKEIIQQWDQQGQIGCD
jgi:hypothetical protein